MRGTKTNSWKGGGLQWCHVARVWHEVYIVVDSGVML